MSIKYQARYTRPWINKRRAMISPHKLKSILKILCDVLEEGGTDITLSQLVNGKIHKSFKLEE